MKCIRTGCDVIIHDNHLLRADLFLLNNGPNDIIISKGNHAGYLTKYNYFSNYDYFPHIAAMNIVCEDILFEPHDNIGLWIVAARIYEIEITKALANHFKDPCTYMDKLVDQISIIGGD